MFCGATLISFLDVSGNPMPLLVELSRIAEQNATRPIEDSRFIRDLTSKICKISELTCNEISAFPVFHIGSCAKKHYKHACLYVKLQDT